MAADDLDGPVAELCAGLRQLQEGSGLTRAALARRLNYSRSQLYDILDGRIRRPPEWDRLVEPLVCACVGDDEAVIAHWRRRHEVLVGVYDELTRRRRRERPPRQRPASGAPARAAPGQGVAARVAPAQLPADVPAFMGRAAELVALDRLLTAGTGTGAGSAAVAICAVSGTAGVGKTALAVHWAHRVRDAFSDGQLYVNLRGYDPDQPLPAAEALAGFLSALGLPGREIPLDLDDRAARYRTEINGRRMLVVLDNAATVEQVRPLLPGTPTCAVLVTSRDSLAGLVALHGAHRLDLDLLPLGDALALLRGLVGGRIDAEPEAAAALTAQCARLPLALRVAAELAIRYPDRLLAECVDELADQQRRLDLLDAGGDPRAAVRGVFSWTYRQLPADAARAFRLLGLHPGPDCDPYAAAALTGFPLRHAERLLGVLTRAHLTHPTRPGRYGMHDLLRAYANDLAHNQDDLGRRRTALTGLFDHYLSTAAAAMDTLHPAEAHRRPGIPPAGSPAPPVSDPATALAWLDTERENLVAVSAHTVGHGWPEHAARLAATLFRYLDAGGHYPEALTIHAHARQATQCTADRAAEANALINLAAVHYQQGRHAQAADHLRQALTLCRLVGDRCGEARALSNLGLVQARQGRYLQAANRHDRALALYRETGDRFGEARSLTNLGLVYARQGRYAQAIDQHTRALTLYRRIGDRYGEANALTGLGVVHGRQGRHAQAADHLRQAFAVCRLIGDRDGEAEVLNSIGESLHAIGDADQARSQHTAALTLAAQTGDRYEQARAHAGLARTFCAAGEPDQARHHWRQALIRYTDLGVPEADHVRGYLDAATAQRPMSDRRCPDWSTASPDWSTASSASSCRISGRCRGAAPAGSAGPPAPGSPARWPPTSAGTSRSG
jgi:tetratricopeptide (TPR) repeat protein